MKGLELQATRLWPVWTDWTEYTRWDGCGRMRSWQLPS